MQEKIKIDIVSDVVCPWCTVGYKRLEKASTELGIEYQVEIEWQPFELNPEMSTEGQNAQEYFRAKYGMTLEQQQASYQQIIEAGAELGFTFDFFDEMRKVNTFDAHVLLEYAKAFGKQTELKMTLTKAFFSERKDVSKREVLKQALLDVGLNDEKGLATLDDDNVRYTVKSNEAYWQQAGVRSVPTVIFNRKGTVTGAQPVDVFKEVLSRILEERED